MRPTETSDYKCIFDTFNEVKDRVDNIKSKGLQATWLVQSVEHASLDLRVINSSPTLGIECKKKKKKKEAKDF